MAWPQLSLIADERTDEPIVDTTQSGVVNRRRCNKHDTTRPCSGGMIVIVQHCAERLRVHVLVATGPTLGERMLLAFG